MSDKEATVYIVDVGNSMTECHGGRVESDLDWGMQYVWDKISYTVAANRKTWTIGVIGLRTEQTNNPQQRDGLEGYDNISVFQSLGPMTMTQLRELKEKIKPSTARTGDAISAIVVAISMIEHYTKQLKYNRKIVLVTDGLSLIDGDEVSEVATKLNEVGIELSIVGIDFDDSEYGFKEQDKPSVKANNEILLKGLVDQCKNGAFGTMAEAMDWLETPRIKTTRPYKTYDGPLTLGDPEKYESAMSIHIERYFKTKRTIPPSTTTQTRSNAPGPSQSSQPPSRRESGANKDQPANEAVKSTRAYTIDDPDTPGGKKEVDFEDLAKGYLYGRTAVYIAESDRNITKFETKKSFFILGFVPFSSYEPFLNMGESCVIVAQKFHEQSELALSSLINALHELESYAVARYVGKDGQAPQILLLRPNPKLEDNLECLYDVPLPFAEDVRSYQFAPLEKVVTITGNILTTHRLLPSNELEKSISDYVDTMDLSTFGRDDEEQPSEYAPISESFNPLVHHIKNCVKIRAIYPDKPLPSPSQFLVRFSQPPRDLVQKNKARIEKLIEKAEVKKIPEKAKFKRYKKEEAAISSAIPVDELLQNKKDLPSRPAKRLRPSAGNGIPEFKQAIQESARNSHVSISDSIAAATKEFGDFTRKLIEDSFANSLYEQAEANLRVMRHELLIQDEPELYNAFVRTLKKSLLSGELNGDRRDMWREHIVPRLGLITQEESDVSNVTDTEAQEFLKATT